MKVGDVMMVFDNKLWGGKDRGDNSQFWKRAEILSLQGAGARRTATVRFEHNNRESRGHFTSGMMNLEGI